MRQGGLRVVLAAAALAGMLGVTQAAGEETKLSPLQLVRSLQLVQDRIAAGDHAVLPMQTKLLEMIDKRFRAASDEELSNPASFRAILVYAMSGGNPATLEAYINRVRLDEEDSRKAIGVLSYLTGGTKSAAVALTKVDPLKQPPELGAFLALVRGSVVAQDDPGIALKYLDQARLLAPGTLVDEAALRRSIPLAVAARQTDRFMLASEQYVRTYLRSPYASQFADSFVSGVVSLHETIDLERVKIIANLMSPEQRHVVYLRIARRSAIDGLNALSQFASEHVSLEKAPEVVDSDPRALLYSILANVASKPIEELQADLARIDRSKLSAGDLKLLDAVMSVSDQMTSAVSAPDDAAAATEVADDPETPVVNDSPTPEGAAAPEPTAPVTETPGTSPAAVEAPAPATETAAPKTAAAPAAAAQAEAEALPPIPEAQPEPSSAAAGDAPQPVAAEGEQPAAASEAAPVSQDPADVLLAEGRKKLEEIDQMLEKAAK